MQDARHIGEVLPPGTANPLPVSDRGGAASDPALCLCDLGRVCLGAFWQLLQTLLGWLEVSFGLTQTTKDGQRRALGTETAKNSLGVLAPTPRVRPNTHSVATTRRISQLRPAAVSQNDDSG